MPNKCSAVNCRSGYSGETTEGISLHSFPLKNNEMLEKWVARILRDGFQPTVTSRLCSKNFNEEDFITQSEDSNISRSKNVLIK